MLNFEDEENIDWDKLSQEVDSEVTLIESSEVMYFSFFEKNKEYEKFFLSIKDDTGKYMPISETEALEFLNIMIGVERDRLSSQSGCANADDVAKENEKKVAFINALLSRYRGNRDIRMAWTTIRAMFAKAKNAKNAF